MAASACKKPAKSVANATGSAIGALAATDPSSQRYTDQRYG